MIRIRRYRQPSSCQIISSVFIGHLIGYMMFYASLSPRHPGPDARTSIPQNQLQNSPPGVEPEPPSERAAKPLTRQIKPGPKKTGPKKPAPRKTDRNNSDRKGMCTSSERLAHYRFTCPAADQTLDQWLDSLTLTQLRAFTWDWLVDENHKVLGCIHSKVASTTWSAILCNNVLAEPLPKYTRFFKRCMAENKIYKLGQHEEFTKADIIDRIKSYYKFMVVRHPLERLLSTWIDKFQFPKDYDAKLLGKHGPSILSAYRPWLPKKVIESGKGVYFQELIQHILAGHTNAHWDGPYSRNCHPCRIDFDAVVKLETFSEDVTPIINTKLSGRSLDTMVNKHGKRQWDREFSLIIPQYRNVTEQQLNDIVKKYSDDFAPLGYGYDRLDNGVVSLSCRMTVGNRTCC